MRTYLIKTLSDNIGWFHRNDYEAQKLNMQNKWDNFDHNGLIH